MKRLIQFFVLVCLAIPHLAFAACEQLKPAQITELLSQGYIAANPLVVNIPFQQSSVSIDPALPIGSVIATGLSPAYATYANFTDCTNGGTVAFGYFSATPSTVSGVYDTNIPGIGFRVTYLRATGTNSSLPFTSNFSAGEPNQVIYGRFGIGSQFQIELVKTGDIGSNVNVLFNTIGTGIANGDGSRVVTITGGGINVKVLPSCTVNTSTLNIDFGTFGPSDVSSTAGPTQPVDFTVLCTGPTPPASITAVLSGTPDTENSSMLKNTGATHLAIRLREVATNTIFKPNDPTSTLVHTPRGAMQSPFELEATVLRVGTATPAAGKIQATATITMTIL
ncbi:fimbrial protein [Paraburkholderia sp. MMS20-SJTN17]|uniref:Fimbrial protein n=1 Tax=Paraburkholderia translucens TaxID=2886945 RepID=A0ABS8KCS8_9BURK|nr:fimbrial protein [Paraburkholderia sp. MMS20-SJTN17]MCC8402576.1 fimbrial protein [Paraburkholderia sp. MMS20-SJTN17]